MTSRSKRPSPQLTLFNPAELGAVLGALNAISRWRDGLGEMAGRATLALRENWRNTDTFVVARIMLEAAYRTDRDLALTWPASKMPPAGGSAQIVEAALHA